MEEVGIFRLSGVASHINQLGKDFVEGKKKNKKYLDIFSYNLFIYL